MRYININVPTNAAPAPVTVKPPVTGRTKKQSRVANVLPWAAAEVHTAPQAIPGLQMHQLAEVAQGMTAAATQQQPKIYENTMSGQLKDLAFAYQRMQGQEPSLARRTLTDREWSELRLRFLTALYSQPGFVAHQDIDIDALCQTVFGIPREQFDKEIRQFTTAEFNPRIKPFPSAGDFERMIPEVLRTRREMERFATIEGCEYPWNPVGKSLQSAFCVLIANDYDRWLMSHESRPLGKDSFIILHPVFFSTFNHLVPFYLPQMADASSKELITLPAIMDAFSHRGMAIISPKLGYVIQKDAPELWNLQYWLPKFHPNRPNYNAKTSERYLLNEFLGDSRLAGVPDANVDFIRRGDRLADAARISLLTLQKHAAIRRWMWTRNPIVCSQVYELNYKETTISPELFRPDLDFPAKGYTFDKAAFDTEFQENQRWVAGNVYFKSYDDPKLKTYLGVSDKDLKKPVFTWQLTSPFTSKMQIPVEPLPEEQTARDLIAATARARPAAFTEENETQEILENLTTRAGRAAVLGRGRNRIRTHSPTTGRFSYRHARRHRGSK